MKLNTEYLKYLECPDIKASSNCSEFRLLLYILREKLFTYVKETFESFIENLSDKSESSIKQEIKNNVRTIHPDDTNLENKAELRIEHIEALDARQFRADWCTFARCYTVRFLTRQQFIRECADPKDLLEILQYCSLFPEELYDVARTVIKYRNFFYAHLDMLLINCTTLKAITYATERLEKLISVEH